MIDLHTLLPHAPQAVSLATWDYTVHHTNYTVGQEIDVRASGFWIHIVGKTAVQVTIFHRATTLAVARAREMGLI